MGQGLRVLLVEDSEEDAELLCRELSRSGYDPTGLRVQSPEELKAALERETWDVVISDYVMPGFDGKHALSIVKQTRFHLPFILVSGRVEEDLAVAAMRAGADDYLMKDRLARLGTAIERVLEK